MTTGDQFAQLPRRQGVPRLQCRHHAPAQTRAYHSHETLGRGAQVVGKIDREPGKGQEAMLQLIIGSEYYRRGLRQCPGGHALGKVPTNETITGDRQVAHGPEWHRAGTGYRALGGADTTDHLPGAHAAQPHILIIHQKLQQQCLLAAQIGHRRRPPGGQTVSIERKAQSGQLRFPFLHGHIALQVTLEHPDLLHMVEQPLPGIGRRRRGCPQQYRSADPRLEQFDTLGYRRLGQAKRSGSSLEPALLHHGRQGLQQFVVQHQITLYPISNIDFPYTGARARLPAHPFGVLALSYYTSFFNGLLVAAGLIMAIGAQNAFVLGQSLKREHHLSVALICMLCDAILITAGVFGLATLIEQHPLVMEIARWGGILFLLGYALLAIRRALGEQTLESEAAVQPRRTRQAVILATLAITLLNPHVYLDTVILIGSVGAQQSWPIWFAAGAASASMLWFFSLAIGGARLAPLLSRPVTWRVIDLLVAAMMLRVAWTLAAPVWS